MTSKAEVAAYESIAVPDLTQLDWDGLVQLGRTIEYASKWTMGDLACQVGTRYGENNLGKFSVQVGVDYSTLRDYKQVSQAYPAESVVRTTHSWSVYKVLAAQPDRVELVAGERMTVTQAQQIVWDRERQARQLDLNRSEALKARATRKISRPRVPHVKNTGYVTSEPGVPVDPVMTPTLKTDEARWNALKNDLRRVLYRDPAEYARMASRDELAEMLTGLRDWITAAEDAMDRDELPTA